MHFIYQSSLFSMEAQNHKVRKGDILRQKFIISRLKKLFVIIILGYYK